MSEKLFLEAPETPLINKAFRVLPGNSGKHHEIGDLEAMFPQVNGCLGVSGNTSVVADHRPLRGVFPVPVPLGTGNTSEPQPGIAESASVKIIVSSLQPHPLPKISPAGKLAEKARAAGWFVRVGYACCDVAERWYLNGNLDRPAHREESVLVWLRRPDWSTRARARWDLCSDWPPTPAGRRAGWRFAYAYFDNEKLTLASITERIGH